MNNDFKIPAKYLIDFDNLKVGDRVWTLQEGYTKVNWISVTDGNEYPIETKISKYTKDGLWKIGDKYPSLFRVSPFEDIREEFFADRLMEVKNVCGELWVSRMVFGKKNGKWLAWNSAETPEESKNTVGTVSWDEAREITPPSEELVHLNLQDISEGRGVGVPAHLIRIKE